MKILICGIGSLGSNLTSMLVPDLRGQHEITILDKDNVEERNVQAGTQFYMPDQIGLSKVDALQYNVHKWFGREIKISTETLGSLKAPITRVWDYDLVIDCFDNEKARQYLQSAFRLGKSLSMLHVGFSDQFTFAIEWAENYKVPSDITSGFDICTTDGAASFIRMVAALVSQVIQEFISTGQKKEFIGNKFCIKEIK